MASTRSQRSFKEIMLGESVSSDHLKIGGCKLPTCHQIIQCLLSQMQFNDLSLREAAKEVISQVIWFYGKAGVPTLHENKLIQEVLKLKTKLDSMAKYNIERRDDIPTALQKFEGTLLDTLPPCFAFVF